MLLEAWRLYVWIGLATFWPQPVQTPMTHTQRVCVCVCVCMFSVRTIEPLAAHVRCVVLGRALHIHVYSTEYKIGKLHLKAQYKAGPLYGTIL